MVIILNVLSQVRDGIDPVDDLLLLWTSRDDEADADWSSVTVVSTGSYLSVTWSVTSERITDRDRTVLLTTAFTASYESIGNQLGDNLQ